MQEMQDVPILLTERDRGFTMRSFRHVSLPAVLILATGLLPVTGCNRGHSADVVATVNGRAIMRAELDKSYREQLGEAPQQRQLPQEQADSLRLNVLRVLIDYEIAEQRAAEMKLEATQKEGEGKREEKK